MRCTPALVVPPHPFSVNKAYAGTRSITWLPVCSKHFHEVTIRDFLCHDEMRRDIEADHRANKSIADFSKAKVLRVNSGDPEFKNMARHMEQTGGNNEIARIH